MARWGRSGSSSSSSGVMCAQSSALPPCLSLVSCCPALLPALLPGTAAGVHRFRPLPRQALLQASDCSRLAELPSLYPGCWPQGVRVCRYLRVPGRGCRGVQQLGSSGCSLFGCTTQAARAAGRVGMCAACCSTAAATATARDCRHHRTAPRRPAAAAAAPGSAPSRPSCRHRTAPGGQLQL